MTGCIIPVCEGAGWPQAHRLVLERSRGPCYGAIHGRAGQQDIIHGHLAGPYSDYRVYAIKPLNFGIKFGQNF